VTLSVRSRFEVFKRDSFTCGYCGRTPDDEGVKLEVDHITPRAAGGGDEMTNLVTSCWDCNHGKAAKDLGDKAPSLTQAMANTRERAIQLDEYRRWQGELDNVNNDLLVRVWQEWIDTFGGTKEPIEDKPGWVTWSCDPVGMPKKDSVLKHFDVLEVADIIDAIHTTHTKWERGGLSNRDVQRYFFGCLKHKREDGGGAKKYSQAEMDKAEDGWGFLANVGLKLATDAENERIRELFINHEAHGFETYADVVNTLWPEEV
jgi:hypothetical protein